MIIRQAKPQDVDQIMWVRHQVKENVLEYPTKVNSQLCMEYLEHKGRGWVCEKKQKIVGFSIAAVEDHSVWALFVLPEFEGQGIGSLLLQQACQWLASTGAAKVTLETGANTRAEGFYQSQGWKKELTKNPEDVKFTFFIKEND